MQNDLFCTSIYRLQVGGRFLWFSVNISYPANDILLSLRRVQNCNWFNLAVGKQANSLSKFLDKIPSQVFVFVFPLKSICLFSSIPLDNVVCLQLCKLIFLEISRITVLFEFQGIHMWSICCYKNNNITITRCDTFVTPFFNF